jgi:Glycosyltransferases involved in cell wall biogenesis
MTTDPRPTVSIVMSVCNAVESLPRALDSLFEQTFPHWELVLIDDGSTDGSAEIIDACARRDSRVRALHQENAGLTRALIRGCGLARGEWIARQDADDWSEPTRFEKCLALAQTCPDCVMVSGWGAVRGPCGEMLGEVRRPADPVKATAELLTKRMGPPAHGGVMMRRDAYEAAGGYRAEFYYGQDSDLWLRIARLGPVAYVQEVLYNYTLSPTSISSTNGRLQWRFGELGQCCHAARMSGTDEDEFLREAARLTEGLRGRRSRETGRKARSHANYHIAMRLFERQDPRAAGYLREAIRLWPLNGRAIVRLWQMSRWNP